MSYASVMSLDIIYNIALMYLVFVFVILVLKLISVSCQCNISNFHLVFHLIFIYFISAFFFFF